MLVISDSSAGPEMFERTLAGGNEIALRAPEILSHEIKNPLAAIRGAVNGMMMQVIQGHLTDHVVKEPEEGQREADLEVVMQVIKSYLK